MITQTLNSTPYMLTARNGHTFHGALNFQHVKEAETNGGGG